jgi:uncharacterized protein YcaQ
MRASEAVSSTRPPSALCNTLLPVLVGDEIVAAIDLKADRRARKLLVRKWTWLADERAGLKTLIEEAMTKFERFQMA